MSTIYLGTFLILLIASLVTAGPRRTDVTVSGISSGGAMATQLHIAFSKDISGCGILAGPPYYCGANGLTSGICMSGPSYSISVSALQLKIKSYSSSGSIDDPSNLKDDPVYVFSGKYDMVANPGVVKLNEALYSRLGANVLTNFDMAANHGFPTEDFGSSCATLNLKNYINNCQFNGAYQMLNHLLGGNLVKPPSGVKTPLVGQMLLFNQDAFINPPTSLSTDKTPSANLSRWIQNNMALYNPADWEWSTSGLFHMNISHMDEVVIDEPITSRSSLAKFDQHGFIYFPSACANGKKCSIHIALHGCQQGKSVVGDVFARRAGYLEVAELNDIIMVFPQIRRSISLPTNPMGCWDWWGYSSIYYATQGGPQMSGIRKMIDTVRIINRAFVVNK